MRLRGVKQKTLQRFADSRHLFSPVLYKHSLYFKAFLFRCEMPRGVCHGVF